MINTINMINDNEKEIKQIEIEKKSYKAMIQPNIKNMILAKNNWLNKSIATSNKLNKDITSISLRESELRKSQRERSLIKNDLKNNYYDLKTNKTYIEIDENTIDIINENDESTSEQTVTDDEIINKSNIKKQRTEYQISNGKIIEQIPKGCTRKDYELFKRIQEISNKKLKSNQLKIKLNSKISDKYENLIEISSKINNKNTRMPSFITFGNN